MSRPGCGRRAPRPMSLPKPRRDEMSNIDDPTPAQRAIGDFAPKLVSLTDDVLFGDVWARARAVAARPQPDHRRRRSSPAATPSSCAATSSGPATNGADARPSSKRSSSTWPSTPAGPRRCPRSRSPKPPSPSDRPRPPPGKADRAKGDRVDPRCVAKEPVAVITADDVADAIAFAVTRAPGGWTRLLPRSSCARPANPDDRPGTKRPTSTQGLPGRGGGLSRSSALGG